MNSDTYKETLYPHYGQSFTVDRIIFEQKTDHHELIIFENKSLGKVMALDGIIQTTEKDEFIYHEMMTHVPMLSLTDQVASILIIGGGDGGILREVCKYPFLKEIIMIEIDSTVVDMSKTYFPKHSMNAFNDPRFKLIIDDGLNFVTNAKQSFDLIIVDSTDPIGPGETLFTQEFYAHCSRLLSSEGFMVTQNGVPFFQPEEISTTHQRMHPHFNQSGFYVAAIPTYIGGLMTLAWASKSQSKRFIDTLTISERYNTLNLNTNYYNPSIHFACFSLPNYILKLLPSDFKNLSI